MATAGTIANNEIRAFKRGTVQLTDGEQFSQYYNIIRIDKYFRGVYMDINDDALFWQLGTPRIPLYAKSIDADTKNFSLFGIGKYNWFKAWILNVRFRQWSREERFAMTLDDTSDGIAKYGSIVWKKSFDGYGKVELKAPSLKNLYFDQTVESIKDSPVVEAHYMTEAQVRGRYPDQATEILKNAPEARDEDNNQAESEDEKYQLIERWGEIENKKQKMEYRHTLTSGEGDEEVEIINDVIKVDKNGNPKDFPYYDFHGERVPGRWQGMGVIERLYPLQEQINALVNQNSDSNDIASLLLLITADENTDGNVLDSARTGQVIHSDDMKQLAIDNRFIGTFINQMNLIEEKANSLCYINDTITGETPPSGVTFRGQALSTRASLGTFKYIKTGILEKMGYILQEDILPEVVKGFNREDAINIMETDADIRMYDEIKVEEAVKKYIAGKPIVFEEDIELVRQTELKRLRREGRKEEGIKFDFKFGVFMNPAGESIDKNTKNAAVDSAIADMSANPAIVNTPLYQQKLEENGISPFRLNAREQAEIQQSQGAKLPQPKGQDKLSQLANVE